MDIGSLDFWISLGKIVWVDLLLGGDNAVVIALAVRSLPPAQQRRAILWGTGAAIMMRVALTFVAAGLMSLPWLKLAGAGLLLYIGVTLLLPEKPHTAGEHAPISSIWSAMRTILMADLAMSVDNVLAVAAAAKGSLLLLVLGLGISIPIVIFGSTLLLRLIERLPVVIWLGAGLLGFIAGEIAVADAAAAEVTAGIAGWLGVSPGWLGVIAGAIGAGFVIMLGHLLLRRRQTLPPGGRTPPLRK
ncbi:MAG: TerC family protein [Burkholderiales bacterium]|nr:MAG: TerC family protein [Burkholderiales bacterium]